MRGKVTDLHATGGLKWPVAFWKSPSIPATAPGTFVVPSPIPPYAFVDYAMERLGTEAGYSRGDHVRLQRAAIAGANDFFHPAWIASLKSMVLLSGNGSNAFYVAHKTTGVPTGLTDGNWNQRLYGAWPMLRDGAPYQRLDRKNRLSLKNSQGIRILRKRARTPWVRGVAAATQYQYDLKNVGHSDEPALIELWAKCVQPDLGYQVGQETPIRGLDAGGGGEVFYNNSTVGFVHTATGFAGVNATTAATGNFDPTRWMFQLRMAFAAEPDNLPDQRQASRPIAFWSRGWRQLPLSTTVGGQSPVLQMPNNFDPIDMQVVFRARIGSVPTSLWSHGDQLYSAHPGYSNFGGWQNFVVEGRKVTLPFGDTLAYIYRSGAGASTYLYASTGSLEYQLRAIG